MLIFSIGVLPKVPSKIKWPETPVHGSLAKTKCQYWGINKTFSAQICGIYKSTITRQISGINKSTFTRQICGINKSTFTRQICGINKSTFTRQICGINKSTSTQLGLNIR